MPDSQCNYGFGPYSLCQQFKATWIAGPAGYAFEFTSTTSGLTYFYERPPAQQPNTFVTLGSVPGLPWGDVFNVNCQVFYNLTNGTGGTEKVYVDSDNICQIGVIASPTMVLRPSDNCSIGGPRLLGQSIAGQPFVCGAVDFEWEFTRTDVPELPIYKLRQAANRFIQLSTIPGLVPGGVYNVRVRPIFASGPGNWGAADCVSIIGPVGINEGTAPADEAAVVRNGEVAPGAMLYPNPCDGTWVNLYIDQVDSDVVTLTVFDLTGKKVHQEVLFTSGTEINQVISFTNRLANGTYMVEINAGSETFKRRLVITG
jgi:hypothetical protein